MKTAVEWLYEQMPKKIQPHYKKQLEQAKEMDKQAHQETWDGAHQAGRFEGKGIAEENWWTFEEYWEENFKSE
jgi:hypothetical protein